MNGRQIFGIIFIILAGLYLLDAFEIMNFSLGHFISNWYPLLIIGGGVYYLSKSSYTAGFIFLTIGLVLQGNKLDLFHFNFWEILFPAILLVVGISLLKGKKSSKNIRHEDKFEVNSFFGGSSERINSDNLKSGEIFVLFGAAEIDLRDAKLSSDFTQLNITAIFGGVELTVPKDWRIHTKGTPIFGAIENKTYENSAYTHTLNINCTTTFGGVEIKN